MRNGEITTITISKTVRQRMQEIMRYRETYSDLIGRLLDFYDKMTTSYTNDKPVSKDYKPPQETPNEHP